MHHADMLYLFLELCAQATYNDVALNTGPVLQNSHL